METEEEYNYREWLVGTIESETGSLDGTGEGIYSLNTKSLEKLYRALTGNNALTTYGIISQ